MAEETHTPNGTSRRQILSLGGGALGAGLLAACGQGAGSSAAAGAQLPETIHFGHPSPAQPVYNFAVYPIADTIFNKRHKSNLKKKVFKGFTPIAGAFISGEVDIAYMSLPSLIKARAQGLPLVVPLGFTKEFPFVLIVSPEVKSWSDLRNKTIALHAPSSMSAVVGQIIIEQELGSQDAVNKQYILGTPNRLAAMKAGQVSGAVVFLSGGLQAQKDGYAKIIGRPWEYDQLSEQTASTLTVLSTTAKEKRGNLQVIVDTMAKAYSRVYEAAAEELTKKAIETGVYSEFDQDVWTQAFKTGQDIKLWPADGAVTKERYEKAQDVLVAGGLIKKEQRVPYNKLILREFM